MNNFDLKAYLASQKLFEAEQPSDEIELDQLDKEISSAFASGLSALQGQTTDIKEQIEEADIQLNEAVGSLIISLLLSAPKLLEIIGGMVKKVATKFAKEKGKVTSGDAFIHAGHYLEGKYLSLLKKIIKVTGIARKANIKTDAELETAAKVLLYSVLGMAAVSAGVASAESIGGFIAGKGVGTAIYGVAKGGLAGLKSTEIIQGIKALDAKI